MAYNTGYRTVSKVTLRRCEGTSHGGTTGCRLSEQLRVVRAVISQSRLKKPEVIRSIRCHERGSFNLGTAAAWASVYV